MLDDERDGGGTARVNRLVEPAAEEPAAVVLGADGVVGPLPLGVAEGLRLDGGLRLLGPVDAADIVDSVSSELAAVVLEGSPAAEESFEVQALSPVASTASSANKQARDGTRGSYGGTGQLIRRSVPYGRLDWKIRASVRICAHNELHAELLVRLPQPPFWG